VQEGNGGVKPPLQQQRRNAAGYPTLACPARVGATNPPVHVNSGGKQRSGAASSAPTGSNVRPASQQSVKSAQSAQSADSGSQLGNSLTEMTFSPANLTKTVLAGGWP
jgi:hypothetical protein